MFQVDIWNLVITTLIHRRTLGAWVLETRKQLSSFFCLSSKGSFYILASTDSHTHTPNTTRGSYWKLSWMTYWFWFCRSRDTWSQHVLGTFQILVTYVQLLTTPCKDIPSNSAWITVRRPEPVRLTLRAGASHSQLYVRIWIVIYHPSSSLYKQIHFVSDPNFANLFFFDHMF